MRHPLRRRAWDRPPHQAPAAGDRSPGGDRLVSGKGGQSRHDPGGHGHFTELAAARPALLKALHQVLNPQAAALASALADGDPALFLRAVRRHRLAVLLAPHAGALGLPPETAAQVVQESLRQQRMALPLIALALELLPALERSGLRALLLKGPALAVQTTGQGWGRGGGDLDLLVAPGDAPAAVAVLEQLGFSSPPGMFPRQLRSVWGRYARWAGHELSLHRPGSPWLDLHWALNTVRKPLPSFEALWLEREMVSLNGHAVPTLGRRHAFQHGCLHAAVDEWMNLNHLVDLARLAVALPAEQRQQLRRLKTVRLSCAAAYDATGCPELLDFSDPHRADCRRAIARAQWTQGRPQRTTADGAWHPGHWLRIVIHGASLSPSPIDWLRVVARFSLVPAGFNDPISGRDRGLAGMLGARWRRLRERLKEHSLGG